MKKGLFKKMAVMVAFVFATHSGLSAQDVVKTVVADCFVKTNGTSPESSTVLSYKHSGATGTNRWIYLRFDISDIDVSKIETAKISMYMPGTFDNEPVLNLKLYPVSDNAWFEEEVVFPGPAFDAAAPFADFDVDGTSGWKTSTSLKDYVISSYNNSDKLMSLVVFSGTEKYYPNNTLHFHSKETDGGNPAKLEVVYGTVTAIDESKNESAAVTVWPTSVKDILNVKFAEGEKWESLSIHNVNGSSVKQINVAGQSGCKVDMNGFSKGIYILKIVGNNREVVQKIIKI
jgi:hypothetical protein